MIKNILGFGNDLHKAKYHPDYEENKGESMNEGIIDLAPKAIRVAIKAIKFARGGFTADEKQELGSDLLELALELLTEVADKK